MITGQIQTTNLEGDSVRAHMTLLDDKGGSLGSYSLLIPMAEADGWIAGRKVPVTIEIGKPKPVK